MSLDNIEFSRAAWKRLQTAFNVTQRPVSLFIGPSADAAAASKTLRRLLQSYLIRAEIHIVENMDNAFELIKRRAENYLADQQFLGVDPQSQQQAASHMIDSTKEVAIFLGCGADRDLVQELDWSALTEIHVIDNCRPVNLNLMRHAVTSAQFLASISDNFAGSFQQRLKKPDRCVFLWEQASAEAEIDEFFWRLEIASRSSNFHLGRRENKVGGHRRQRNETVGQPISSNNANSTAKSNNNNNNNSNKQNDEKRKKPTAVAAASTSAADGGEDIFDIIEEMEGKKMMKPKPVSTTTTATTKTKTKTKKNNEDAALGSSGDDDEESDDDDDDDDIMSSERSVDDDDEDEEDEDFIQDDDESLGAQSDSDDDQQLGGNKKKKNDVKKNKSKSKKKHQNIQDLDDEEQQLLGATSTQETKKSSTSKKKNKKSKSSTGGENEEGHQEAQEQDDDDDDDDDNDAEDDEDWLANSDEDESDNDDDDDEEGSSGDDGDDDDDGETASNNNRTQTDAMTGDDWSSVFTGGRLSSRQFGSKKNKNGKANNKNVNKQQSENNDDDEDEDSFDDDNEQDEDLLNRMDPEVAGVWRNQGAISAQRERAYYSRYWSSRALGVILHELSVRLEQADPDFVWHAAIGLADLHQRGLISASSYEIEVRRLENAVSQFKNALKRTAHGLALLPDNMNGYNQNHLNNNNNNQVLAGAGIMNAAPSAMGASGKLTRVRPLRHIKLFMLRHGSLWNALWLDRHISAALGFHHISSGTARLEGLLAKIGMPRHEAELPWNSIASEKREAVLQLLYSELRPLVADFDSGLYVPTLAKQVGYDSPVSAFDACNVFYGCIGAQPQQHHINIQQQMRNNNNSNNNNNSGFLHNNINLILEEYRTWQEDDYRRRFEAGVAVMSETPEAPLFQHAVNSAFELQAAAAEATASILSGAGGGGAASLASTQHVRYVTIPLDHRIASIDHFAVPGRLRALALFLSAFTHNYRKNTLTRSDKDMRAAAASLRPLVIGVADAATSQLTNGNVVLGSVALVVAPALYQSSTSSTNASIVPSKVLSNYRAVQASLQMNSKFCGVHRDVVIGTVVGADAIMEAGELLHLESVANSALQHHHHQQPHPTFNAATMFIS